MHGDVIAEEQREINRLALAEILIRVCKTRGRATEVDENQIDFWSRNRLKKAITIIGKTGGKSRPSPYDMSFEEFERYVDEHSVARPIVPKDIEDMRLTMEAVRPFALDPTASMGTLWKAKRDAEEAA